MKARLPWLLERAAASPEALALEAQGRRIRYGDLARRAGARAAVLRELGIGPGATLALLLEDGLDFAEWVHAGALRGATLLPLNRRQTPRELAHALTDGAAQLLLYGEGALGQCAREAGARVAGLELASAAALGEQAARSAQQGPREPVHEPFDPEATFAVLFTSGTTGAPRGAELSYASFEASAMASALHLGVLPRERWLACLPLYHVGGLSILVRSVLQGTAAVLHAGFDPEAVSAALEQDRIGLVSLVPTTLARLLEVRGARRAPEGLRCALLGGAGAPEALLLRARELGYPLAPSYGLTEACSQVATRRPDDDERPLAGGLAPLVGTQLRILGEAGESPGPGGAGEILVRGPSVMRGYRGRPVESAAALRGGWLHTGDIGALDPRGRLRVLDRRSDLVVSGGENVYPAEVEAVLHEHPAVREAGVAGVPDAEFGRRPAAWIVARGAPPSVQALREFCRERLAAYKVPVAFTFVAALPRSASGKLLRRKLAGGGEE